MVSQNPAPSKGGHASHPSQGYASSNVHVLMCAETVDLTTHAKTYENIPNKDSNGGSPKQPFTSTLLHFIALFL